MVAVLINMLILHHRQQQWPHHQVLIIDKNGKTSDDPANFHALLPLGGPEHSSLYLLIIKLQLVDFFLGQKLLRWL